MTTRLTLLAVLGGAALWSTKRHGLDCGAGRAPGRRSAAALAGPGRRPGAGRAGGGPGRGVDCGTDCFPSRKLPRNRVRQMRLRWGRLAAARRARRSRPSLSLPDRLFCPALTSVLVARAHYNHACRGPVEEHVIYIAPPRAGKTGALADVIAHHPGAVVATTTRGDLHALTAGIRAARGPVLVFSPQRLADVASTMRWDTGMVSPFCGG